MQCSTHQDDLTPHDMIVSRFREAGRSDPLFSDDAIALIHDTSRGYPRAVNNLAMVLSSQGHRRAHERSSGRAIILAARTSSVPSRIAA